ncbi:MAG: hypothetical protein ISS26_07940 [Candidatus Omnitrophica bacterium]|nr:hypothetical protein [Candidatus Omnitrophota bacterium]
MTVIKRLVSLLKSVRQEIKIAKLLPVEIIKDADRLIDKLEVEQLNVNATLPQSG